jgi:hypothetical protein
VAAALEAVQRGYTPLPINAAVLGSAKTGKNPPLQNWTHLRWESANKAEEAFTRWQNEGVTNIGLVLGEASGGLVDVDLDHTKALRLRDYFLPPTPMKSGRAGRRLSHQWYLVEGDLPATRRHKMPDGSVSVELRASGHQTVIPPSVHYTGEEYRWEGESWGGKKGPAPINGRVLEVQVALLGLGAVLLDNWPRRGGRHDAYLALAGGLLRHGDAVHPYWERNLPVLIRSLALATHDDDGPDAREKESIRTTVERLRSGEKVVGFPRLAEVIGTDHAELVRRMARELEGLAGFDSRTQIAPPVTRTEDEEPEESESLVSSLPPENRNPLEERAGTWARVDLDPYLYGVVKAPEARVLRRDDGKGLFYEGRVNLLFGGSETAKSWICAYACGQEIALGSRVMYLDFEDEPAFTIVRLRDLGVGDDDIRFNFTYIRPEDPISTMERTRWGGTAETTDGKKNAGLFKAELERTDPSLIIVDGMTVLYGLHGLDTNDASSTDVITSWLKTLTRNGRSTVIVIDHTGKGTKAGAGASPIGAHHKTAMVQGSSIQTSVSGRQPSKGEIGEVTLHVQKDRPGAVRALRKGGAKAPIVGKVTIDSKSFEDRVLISIKAPDEHEVDVEISDQGQAMLDKAEAAAAKKLREAAEAFQFDERVIEVFGGVLGLERTRVQIAKAMCTKWPDDYPDELTVNYRLDTANGKVLQRLCTGEESPLVKVGGTRGSKYALRDPGEGEGEQ